MIKMIDLLLQIVSSIYVITCFYLALLMNLVILTSIVLLRTLRLLGEPVSGYCYTTDSTTGKSVICVPHTEN